MSDEYKEIVIYNRTLRYYNEEHIEMEFQEIPNNWRRKKMSLSHGYLEFKIVSNDKSNHVRIHRLVFWIKYPKWNFYDGCKDNIIDHIDGNPANNKIENLRCITQQENNWNRCRAKGYTWRKKRNKYQAYIEVNYKKIYLGDFVKEEDARKAYLVGKSIYHIIRPKTVFL